MTAPPPQVRQAARSRYDIYINTPDTGCIHAADCIVEEVSGTVEQVAFRYREEYLDHACAFPIDPGRPPHGAAETVLPCRGGVPAFIDDYLPDAWGRTVLATLAFYGHGARHNANSVIDTLPLLGGSRVGALSFGPAGQTPKYDRGHPLADLAKGEAAATRLDSTDWHRVDLDEATLLHLAHAGSGVGGARPKMLVSDTAHDWLAKFNRRSGRDGYNNARVELACTRMARAAGLSVADGRVLAGINGRDVLLLERFDVAPGGRRYHLITANGLLKERGSERDSGLPFSYDDVADLVCRHSVCVAADLEQLFCLALFNRAINNTDDHARNFSFIHRGDGYRLAPAYDLVPNLAAGEYHAAAFGYLPYPPRPSEANRLGKVFGLSKPQVRRLAEQVTAALARWPEFADAAGVAAAELDLIAGCLNH